MNKTINATIEALNKRINSINTMENLSHLKKKKKTCILTKINHHFYAIVEAFIS